MTAGFVGVVAMAMVCLAPVVLGTSHLSFSANSTVNITRSGCGVSKLCVETPDDCDPAGNTACLFFSVDTSGPNAPNGFDLAVQLRGDSSGYIAVALTANATMDTSLVFVCARNQTSDGFFFRTAERNNTAGAASVTLNERTVRDIRGTVNVNGSVIQCEFTIPMVNATAPRHHRVLRHMHVSSFAVQLGVGPVTGGTTIGDFNVSVDAGRLNLANPASNIAATTAASATAGPTVVATTASGIALRSQAVLVLLGAVAYLLS